MVKTFKFIFRTKMAETRAQREARRRANISPRGGRRSATPGSRAPSPTASARRGSSSVVHVGRGRRRQRSPSTSPSPSPPPRPMGHGVRSPTRPRAPARRGRRSRSRSRRGSTPASYRSRRSTSRRGMRSRSPRSRQPRRRPRSPSARTLKLKLLELDAVKKKLEKIESKRKEKEWANKGIQKQAEFATDIREYHEELNMRLEMEFGPVSDRLREFIKQGESKVHNRIHLLKIADKYGWAGATDFQEEELARDEKEEKKLRVIRKDFEAKKDKRSQGGGKYRSNHYKGKGTDNYKDTRYDFDNSCEKAAGNYLSSSGSKIRLARRNVTSVVASDTWLEIAGTRRGEEKKDPEEEIPGEEEDEAEDAVKDLGAMKGDYNFIRSNTMKYNSKRDLKPEYPFDKDDIDNLEGITIDFENDDEYIDGMIGKADNTDETGVRVVDALKSKVDVWKQFGAGGMVVQVITKGLRLNFTKKMPTHYSEPNNQSFKRNLEFGHKEVFKLLDNGVIEEVEKKDITCVNPLSVAANKKGKLRLCLDLSRHVNLTCDAKRFKIESITEFVKVVRKGAWVVYYDLKSAFHHVEVISKHRRFLGFSIIVDGKAKFYQFKQMPFGYRDASRILTKVMRTPVNKWRAEGIANYIHIDDGLAFKQTREECEIAAKTVKDDLEKLGLVTSPEKCCWIPKQQFTWCGFDWDLAKFTVAVTEEKKTRIKELARELKSKDRVTVKEVASFTGLVISCTPAIGRSSRFHTRSAVRWVQDVVDEEGWGATGVLSRRVREELEFWLERLDEFSSQSIRKAVRIMEYYVCSDGGQWYIGGRVARKGTEIESKRFQYPLEDWEAEESSTYRELRSMEIGLTLIGPEARGCVLRYGNDNYAAVKAAAFGSTKEKCHAVAKRINELCDKYEITLEVVWRRRNTEEIVLCDKISKTFDLGEFRLEAFSFWALEQEFGPWQVDWFASAWSSRLPVFASRFWTVGATWTDAFTQEWGSVEGFFHPPLDQLARCLEKISMEGARGVLVVPDWPGSEADSIMIQARDRVELLAVRHVEFESPTWRTDNTFRGWPEFGLRVYKIKN